VSKKRTEAQLKFMRDAAGLSGTYPSGASEWSMARRLWSEGVVRPAGSSYVITPKGSAELDALRSKESREIQ